MNEILNELATIEVSSEVLQQMELDKIYESFRSNYQKLDGLKNFRESYEKKGRLMRWWHNDKLRDAQLDSAEVQAEFSKTIGQLMMLSIMQSKELTEQQTQINAQQGKLKRQADGIEQNAEQLQQQHTTLAEQSAKLETLVHEYFALKGLTEEGAQKLIDIANDIKATKSSMLDEFSNRAGQLERLGEAIHTRLDESEATQRSEREDLARSLQLGLTTAEERQRVAITNFGRTLEQVAAALDQRQGVVEDRLVGVKDQSAELTTALAAMRGQLSSIQSSQQTQEAALADYRREIAGRFKHLHVVISGLSVAFIIALGGVAHIAKVF